MAPMSHRERVMAALNHQEPDRVPMDLGGTIDSSIVVEGYARLKDHFGVQAPDALTSRMMRVVDVDERILRALDIDTRGVFPPNQPDVFLPGDRYRDEWGVERVRPEGSFYYDQVRFPLAGEITIRDIANYAKPDPHDPVRLQGVRERLAFIRRETDCAAVLNLPSAFVHRSQYLRGFEDWFADFAGDRKLLGALFDSILDVNLAICEVILREVGSEVDILLASDDLGMQNGLMIAPQAYREMIKPRHKKYFQLLHDLSPAKLLFHSCGSLIDIMDDLVEIGVDVLHPVQVAARGMDPAVLKARWGDRLSFWGGVDTQGVLPHGTVEEVRAETRQRIDQFGQGGGYVLGAVHNLQPDVPVANILAMYDEGKR